MAYLPGYGEGLAYESRFIDKCGAVPRGGDGSLCCGLEAFHDGLHKADDGTQFRYVYPGTSPRSTARTRIRLRDSKSKIRRHGTKSRR